MADYKPNHVPAMAIGYPASTPQQLMPGFPPQAPSQWSTGLCDCFDDVGNCCLTLCCPCFTFGRIAEIVDRGSTACGTAGALYLLIGCLTGCECLYACSYRAKLRALYALPESPCNDCIVHFCCETCALCQAHRELQNRGFDMTLGWHGNMEKMQGAGLILAPPMQGAMIR